MTFTERKFLVQNKKFVKKGGNLAKFCQLQD